TRDRYARYVLRFILVFSALLLGARPRRLRPRRGGILDAGRPVYRRRRARRLASALFALLHACAEALRLSRPRRAVCRPLHPRHGLAPDLPNRCRRVAFPRRGNERRQWPAARSHWPTGDHRPHRKDEQVEKER